MSDEFVEKKSVGKILLTIFIVLIIIGGIIFGGYKLLSNTILNPEKYLIKTKEFLTKDFKVLDVFNDEINNKDVKFDGTITFKTDNKDMNYLNHFNVDYSMLASFNKEEIQYNYKFKEDDKELLNTNIYLIKDSLYLDSNDLYNKILLIEKLDYNIFGELKNIGKESNENINDLKNGLSNYLESIMDALKEMKMTSEFVSIYKVKYTYEINDSNKDKIQNKYDELIKNNKTIQALIKDEKIDKNLFDIKFSNFKIEIIKSIGTNKIYNLDIYEDGKNSFKLEMDEDDDNIYHITSGDDKGTLTINRDTYTLQLFDKDVLLFTIKLENNDNLFKISMTKDNEDISFGLKKENKNKVNITFGANLKDGSFDLTMTASKTGNVYNIIGILDINSNGEKIRMKLDGNGEYKDNILESKDISNAVDINTLNESDQNKISENLMKKLNGSKLLELLSNVSNV